MCTVSFWLRHGNLVCSWSVKSYTYPDVILYATPPLLLTVVAGNSITRMFALLTQNVPEGGHKGAASRTITAFLHAPALVLVVPDCHGGSTAEVWCTSRRCDRAPVCGLMQPHTGGWRALRARHCPRACPGHSKTPIKTPLPSSYTAAVPASPHSAPALAGGQIRARVLVYSMALCGAVLGSSRRLPAASLISGCYIPVLKTAFIAPTAARSLMLMLRTRAFCRLRRLLQYGWQRPDSGCIKHYRQRV